MQWSQLERAQQNQQQQQEQQYQYIRRPVRKRKKTQQQQSSPCKISESTSNKLYDYVIIIVFGIAVALFIKSQLLEQIELIRTNMIVGDNTNAGNEKDVINSGVLSGLIEESNYLQQSQNNGALLDNQISDNTKDIKGLNNEKIQQQQLYEATRRDDYQQYELQMLKNQQQLQIKMQQILVNREKSQSQLKQEEQQESEQQSQYLQQEQQQMQIKKSAVVNPQIPSQLLTELIQVGPMRAGIPEIRRKLWLKFLELKGQPLSSQLAQQQKQYYEQKYNISQFKQLPFCIVVPSYVNVENNRYLNNINSILQQDYGNYHIVWIDDASDDGTGQKMTEFVAKHKISQKKLKLIINKNRKMALPNIYQAAQKYCKKYQLFLLVDGDDQLIGKQVLKLFNAVFQSKDVWIVYSNFITPNGNIGFSRPYHSTVIQSNGYRKGPFTISHLRVFYTKLLTLIKQDDLKDEKGQWFRASNDVAMYMPMLQMCHTRLQYIRQISYLYNPSTGLNNHKSKYKQQRNNEKTIRAKSTYSKLESLFTESELARQKKKMGRRIRIRDRNDPDLGDRFDWENQT